MYWYRFEKILYVNEIIFDNIYGLKNIIFIKIVIILGIKVSVCFWIWVVVWKILIMSLIIRVSSNKGSDIIKIVYMFFFVNEMINFLFIVYYLLKIY